MVTHGGSVRPNSIPIFSAVRILFAHFKEIAGDSYIERNEHEALNALWTGEEAPPDHKLVLSQRACLLILRALLSGDLHAHFSDGLDSCDVPGWAWETEGRTAFAWGEGRLPLDVFLPEEWQRWSCHKVFLDEEAFTGWVRMQTLHDPVGLPELPPPYDARSKPKAVKKRLPPDTPFVTLSEALTWIAFGFALDRNSLDRAISGHAFDAADPQAALADAMAKLAVRASGGQITARGKYVESHSTDENKVLTAPIDPVRFEDFAQFDILYDGLRYGIGLTWEERNSTLDRVLQDRRDAFRSVKVNRADLLRFYPPDIDNTRALLSPLPASLPEIGPVMGMEEALSRLAHGKPSDDVQLWQNPLGWLQFRYSTGEVFNVGEDAELPEHHRCYREANRLFWTALQGGAVAAFVHVAGAGAFSVPRYYWNQVQTDHLDHVFRGMSDADEGRGCPILLSRLAFDTWRTEQAGNIQTARAPAVKAGRPPSVEEILAKADEMKANGMDGRTIAKEMRHQPGFANVATTEVRELIKGRWKPGGRPKKNCA